MSVGSVVFGGFEPSAVETPDDLMGPVLSLVFLANYSVFEEFFELQVAEGTAERTAVADKLA